MADDKKPPAKRLGGLNSGPGAGRLGSLRTGDGAGPSSAGAPSATTGGAAAGGQRKMRFMPTNFARPKARADSTSEGAPSASVSAASKSESAFEDLIKVSKSEAAWQRRGGRGGFAGRGPGRSLTTFGGGAGEVPGGAGPSGGRRVWGGTGGIAGRGGGGAAATKRLVKAGGAAVKAEPKDEAGEDGKGAMEGVEAAAEELEELEFEEDPISYDQYFPAMLPHRQEGELLAKEPDDPAAVIPKDLFDLPEDYRPQIEEMAFLQDVEQNDGRLMLFQLPALLPLAQQIPGANGAGPSVAASRPATLKEVPSCKMGKLLVFESGKVKLQIGDVLLDVNPGIPPRFRQDVAIVSAQSKRCVMLGDVRLRMVASPNVETLLDPEDPLPMWQRTGAAVAADGGKAAAAAAAARGKRAVVLDDESSEDVEEMDVDGGAAAAANGTQQGPAAGQQQDGQQQQQQQQQQQRAGKQLQAVVVKSEEGEEEEVVSPRRGGGLRSPRGRKAAGGGGSGGGAS